MSLPLAGLRVLDFSRLLPGGFCTLVLADMGAEVVKVEQPPLGDPMRYLAPSAALAEAWFAALHRGKRSVTLNLRDPRGQAAAKRLAERSDVVVESFRPGVAKRLGVDYATLAARQPRLVYCSITGYGQSGPYRDRANHDINHLGYAGLAALNGPADGPPVAPPVQVADLGGAAWPAATAILAALLERERTGRGRYLDVAMLDGTLAWMGLVLAGALAGGPAAKRGALPLSGGLACYGLYRTADGRYMALGALEPPFWQAFCRTIGRPDLEPLQYDLSAQPALADTVAEVVASQTRAAWTERFADVDACFTPVLEPDEVADDPQVRARKVIVAVDGHPQVAPPVRFTHAWSAKPAPPLGAHTEAVLAEAGYGPAEIATLRADGVV